MEKDKEKFYPQYFNFLRKVNEFLDAGSTGSIAFNNKWLYFSGTDSTHYK